MASVLSEPARATGGNAYARRTATVKSIFGFIVIFRSAPSFLHKCFMLTYSQGHVPSPRNRAAKRPLPSPGDISFWKRVLCQVTMTGVLAGAGLMIHLRIQALGQGAPECARAGPV
jgi:hypothetical protein